jgi:DNA-binding NtrC family response regulator
MSNVRVLIVDDELLIRWSLREALAERGYDVTEAADGQTAMRALRDGSLAPDVVLLDYRLPDSQDLELFSRIKSLVPHSRVILMTAYGTPDVTKTAIDLGAYHVLMKPFEVKDVAALLPAGRGGPMAGCR